MIASECRHELATIQQLARHQFDAVGHRRGVAHNRLNRPECVDTHLAGLATQLGIV